MRKSALPEQAAFEALYARHWKSVYRLCFTYLRNEAEAEDAAEDVFVKVLAGGLVFSDELGEKKWLTVTACNLCKDNLRSRRQKESSLEDEAEPTAPTQEDLSDVLEAVLALPAKYKDVVWLYYYEDRTTDEIAAFLGRPPSTVRNQLRDARAILKQTLGGIYGE